jgi:tetratricopeptide (TPR) repeat protein
MRSRFVYLLVSIFVAPLCWAQSADRLTTGDNATTVIGPRNLPLYDGAQALLAEDNEKGVELTLKGLEIAMGSREHEAALSNLCAGYIRLGEFSEALKYCNLLLTRNDKNWRGYNNRAVAYIMTKQWAKAEQDLLNGEALNPGARTLKVARGMYMDAVHPVRPEIEIDDRQDGDDEESQQK